METTRELDARGQNASLGAALMTRAVRAWRSAPAFAPKVVMKDDMINSLNTRQVMEWC